MPGIALTLKARQQDFKHKNDENVHAHDETQRLVIVCEVVDQALTLSLNLCVPFASGLIVFFNRVNKIRNGGDDHAP